MSTFFVSVEIEVEADNKEDAWEKVEEFLDENVPDCEDLVGSQVTGVEFS